MNFSVLSAVFLPFLGTVIGAAFVFFLKGQMPRRVQRALMGFAAGVMVAASIWSLIIPAMDQSAHMGKLAFLPAFIGVWCGVLFLLFLDRVIPHLHLNSSRPEGKASSLGKSAMMVLAVALHNFPEGMAVGVVAASWLAGNESISATAALAGGLLNIKPVISIQDGEIVMLGKARGAKLGSQMVSQEVEKTGGVDFEMPILFGYTGLSGELLEKYAQDNAELWKNHTNEIPHTSIGSVVGTHAGPGAFAVAFFKK